jgi:hypothetical protein
MALIDLILFAVSFAITSLPLGFTSTLFWGRQPIKAMLPRAGTTCTAHSSSHRRE